MKAPLAIAALALTLTLTLTDRARAEPASAAPNEPAAPPKEGGPDVHLGATGIYRHLSDVPLWGAGLSISVAQKKQVSSAGTLRITPARTQAGLAAFEAALSITFELHVIDELRFHIGGGLDMLGVTRATTHDTSLALGPSLLVGLGLETGRSGVYGLIDLEGMMYGSGSETIYDWGPTLTIGYRF